jgi:beta-galactosidase
MLHDTRSIHYAVRTFAVRGKQFYLNDRRIVPRGISVGFHRWTRSREGVELAYDEPWFMRNILQRSRDLGANYIRFHLGAPPERFLDLCDRHGMLVQFEWSFFHGMPATLDSLMEQYGSWLDLAVRHPCVVLVHPYNETEGRELKTAWAALDRLLPDYPPMVLADRDVIHVHKYWWSLFENLGLYYDDARTFPKAVMADEFGGNYLDRDGNPGQYPTVKESFMRFLGRDHTRAERLAFHAESNGKVAEYWRRIGAGGFSPFTALGSDGSNWFLGPLREGNPMPVWQALAPAFSPQAASLELWDRHFVPRQALDMAVVLFNEEDRPARLAVQVTLEDGAGKVLHAQRLQQTVGANARLVVRVALMLPAQPGDYTIKARVLNPPPAIKAPVVSAWDVQVMAPVVPPGVRGLKVAVATGEHELRQFLAAHDIGVVAQTDASADVILTSTAGWRAIAAGESALAGALEAAIGSGRSVVMLDIGTRRLGQGYPRQAGDLGPLQGVAQVAHPDVVVHRLFGGMAVQLTETAEPESHIHPDRASRALWGAMPDRATRLWNGMRGGLIVPAEDMELTGLSAAAYTTGWQARGADPARIAHGPYFAYELQGFYGFADRADDRAVADALRERVRFLVRDAPALAVAINPDSPQRTTDLHQGFLAAQNGQARSLAALATAGKNLTRTPVALVDFGPGKGRLIVSQLLTAGRLAPGFGEAGLYGIRHDPVAAQMVLNMLALLRA